MKHPLFVFPDYRLANPYQKLLYEHVDKIFDVQFGDIERAAVVLRNTGLGRQVLFHLHWEDAVYRHAVDEDEAWERTQSFLDQLEYFVGAGGKVLWTVHNKAPHNDPYPDIHPSFCEKLMALVDGVHVHSPSAARWLTKARDVDPSQISIVPHGNYCPVYKNPAETRAECRADFDLAAGDRVFLHFGRLGAYKGVEDLLRAFSGVADPESRLVIAGKPVPPLDDLLDRPEADLPERVLCKLGFIDETELVRLFHIADVVVLPYKDLLTSGTLMLALSLGKPVVLPNCPELLDIVSDGVEAIVYRRGEEGALTNALQHAAALPDDAVRALGDAALERAMGFDWRFLGSPMSGLFHRLIGIERARRRLPLI